MEKSQGISLDGLKVTATLFKWQKENDTKYPCEITDSEIPLELKKKGKNRKMEVVCIGSNDILLENCSKSFL